MTEGRKGRLLVVDDEAAQVQALCDTLEDQGYEVFGCTNGEAALVALQRTPFDLLLADLTMPEMNGIASLRAALLADLTLVGIIMTGEGTIGTAVEAMQSGALDYILKPFKLSAVLPVLGRGLTMRRLRLENAALERRVQEHAAELEAANRELDAFTRSASHDLRSPLNVVLGFSSLLVSKLGPQIPAEQRGWLVHVERSARRMYELIDALMRLSHLGRQALSLRAVDVAALVRSVVDDLRQEQPQRIVTLQIGALPETMADASLLRRVFVNLLSNAFKFTRNTEHAVIEVGSELQARSVSLHPGQRSGLRHGARRAPVRRVPSPAPRRGVRVQRRRPFHRASHRATSRRTHLGRGRPGPGRELLLHAWRGSRTRAASRPGSCVISGVCLPLLI